MFSAWRTAFRNPAFRLQFMISVILLVVMLNAFTRFLEWVELRDGAVLPDPLLEMIPPRDFTWVTFGIIYAGLLLAIVYLANSPERLLLAVQAYMLMLAVRAFMMYLTPLNPSPGLIVLRDPLVEFAGDGNAPTKDLFFSGHTSTMFLLSLVISRKWVRRVYLLFTIVVAVCVVWQHVHYVIDVLVAPFVAFVCYRMARQFQQKTLGEPAS
ncbi:MAG: phosphatase PAP2 family protein [Bacteroidetes bacterium]|nr:phosphatase PAP2 family protein [Bacteroidota bacterium]MCW5894090.1 phosphatase PAP2 family protein [Bacteroidota bacterium]